MRRTVMGLGMTVLVLACADAGAAPAVTTELVDVSSQGVQARFGVDDGVISNDGSVVAFQSFSPNLVPHDTNHNLDIFVRDLGRRTTERVSVATSGAQSNGGFTADPSVSATGRYVAFTSDASNLVANDTNFREDVFVRDRVRRTTERVSVSSTGRQARQGADAPSLSGNGRLVAFASFSANLIRGDTNRTEDVLLRDRSTGETTRLSVSSAGVQADGRSLRPSMSENGRFVAFVSDASNLVQHDTNHAADVFVRDLVRGTTQRVDVSSGGAQARSTGFAVDSTVPSISADGRFVAFTSVAANLVPGDANGTADVFIRDRKRRTTRRVSVSSAGAEANGRSIVGVRSISAAGRFVAFESDASNLVPGDTNGVRDVFLRDRRRRTTRRLDLSSAGVQANDDAFTPTLSDDARAATFLSTATNLVPDDQTSTFIDLFLRRRAQGPLAAVPR